MHIDLKGLHTFDELGKGSDIDTTEELEVHEGFALEPVILITKFRFSAKPTGSLVMGDIEMSTELNIVSMVRTPKAQESWAEVIRTSVEVRGGSEGGLEESISSELRGVGRGS